MPLDPVIAALYRKAARGSLRRPTTDPVARRTEAKAVESALFAEHGEPGPDVATSEYIVGVVDHPDVRLRFHRPPTPGPHPASLTFFGGAFRQGGIDYASTDAMNRWRTLRADVVTVAVDYALAPEHKYPAAVEQGHAALDWLFIHGESLGIDTGRIAIGGQSSGGNIAAVVALMNRDRSNHPLALTVLEVPSLDLTRRSIDLTPARQLHIPGFLLKRGLVSVLTDYFDDYRVQALEPYASPLRAPSLAGLPPTYILTAEYDVLRGDGAAYANALRLAGVEASATVYIGQTHESAAFTRSIPAARRWNADVVDILKTLHDQPPQRKAVDDDVPAKSRK
jgi:acetyl esterase